MKYDFDIAESLRGMIGMELILIDAANEINALRNAILRIVMDENECREICTHECRCKAYFDLLIHKERENHEIQL